MSEMTIEDGVVVSVSSDQVPGQIPGRIIVRIEKPKEDCEGCHSCAVKGLCRGRNVDNHIDLPVRVPAAHTPSPGQNVRIVYRRANQAVAALALFLPALIGLCIGGFVANRHVAGDGAFLAGCGIGLALGAAVTVILARSSVLKPDAVLVSEEAGGV